MRNPAAPDRFLFPSLPPAYRHARSVNGFAVLHYVPPLRVTAAAHADAGEVSGRGTSPAFGGGSLPLRGHRTGNSNFRARLGDSQGRIGRYCLRSRAF